MSKELLNTGEIRIFGPPGTGKTTTLAKMIREMVESGIDSEDSHASAHAAVLVASFTRAAARELVSRNLPIADDHIGTLHALAFRSLDRPKILTGSLLQDWNKQHPTRGVSAGAAATVDDPYGSMEGGGNGGDLLLQQLNRLRGLQVDEAAWPIGVRSFAASWKAFKDDTFTVDFTDLIEQCLRERVPIPHGARVLFLDEVQDFSPLELALARHWGSQCDVCYLAGDDDQCLYRFKGATPDAFLKPALSEDRVRVLDQSYRVPRAVHAVAQAWIEGVKSRQPKLYRPRDYEGVVDTLPRVIAKEPSAIHGPLEQWLAAGKTVAFLASCSYLLEPLKALLRLWGMPFHNPYRKTRGDWNPLTTKNGQISSAERVLSYAKVARILHGEFGVPYRGPIWWSYGELWKWIAPLNAEGLLTHGAKTVLRAKGEADETARQLVTVEELNAWFTDEQAAGAAYAADLVWFRRRFLESYKKPMSYACDVLQKRGAGALTRVPQIILGTIHSVKGGEADIVVLFPDLSPAGYLEWDEPGDAHDSVRRCFYVGMTRAKEALYFAEPSGLSIDGYL